MRCEQVEQLLSLEDRDARVDPARLAEHLAECEACRGANPEVAWMMAAVGESDSVAPLPAVELHRRRWPWLAAAAAALLGISVVGLREQLSSPLPPEHEVVNAGPTILNAEALTALTPVASATGADADESSSSENTLISWHDGRRITSTIERSVWRARPESLPYSGEQR